MESGEYGGVTPADLEDLQNVNHTTASVGDVLAVSSVESGHPTWSAETASGGGGTSTPPGQAAHYIGTWDVAVAYAAGECVRQWDGSEFKLYQAKKATTGDDPTSVVASWAEVTTPIVMWGSEDPNTTDSANPNGGGILAPFNSAYQRVSSGNLSGFLYFTGDGTVVGGVGLWAASTTNRGEYVGNSRVAFATGDQDADASTGAVAAGAGTARAGTNAEAGGAGSADARSFAQLSDPGGGTAQAGGRVQDSNGDEAHLIATATGTADLVAEQSCVVYDPNPPFDTLGEAYIRTSVDHTGAAKHDVKADIIFTDNTEGVVLHDQSDGHTYRIVCTAGVLSTVLVT